MGRRPTRVPFNKDRLNELIDEWCTKQPHGKNTRIAFHEQLRAAIRPEERFPAVIEVDWLKTSLRDGKITPDKRRLLEDILGCGADELALPPAHSARSVPEPTGGRMPSDESLPPSPQLPALHQLRAPPADFRGRDQDLTELRAHLVERKSVSTLHLTGQGGIGKTALALVLAQELKAHYPDAQFDIDLMGASESGQKGLSPADVMERIIRAFSPGLILPKTEGALGSLYRSVLHGKRALLLLDNARDSAQVEPLIPPVGCFLIVTSRHRFLLPGSHLRKLASLEQNDAAKLVLAITPRLEALMAARVAEFCEGLPLALRTAASILAEEEDLEPADYLKQLRTAKRRLEPVEATLRVSLDYLEPFERKAWVQLSVFPGEFDQEAATAVTNITKDTLSSLLKYSLLEYNRRSKYYRMHDLSRAFAASRLGASERHATEQRSAKYFSYIVSSSDEQYYMPRLHIPWAERLIDVVGITRGCRVLNVACGPGALARLAALRAGKDGRVTGIDINPKMIAEARTAPLTRGAAPIKYIESSATSFRVSPGAYDIVICKGLDFIDYRDAALTRIHQALRPGGKLGATVWAAPDESSYFGALMAAVRETLPPKLVGILDRLFTWTNRAAIRDTVEAAGFSNVHIEVQKLPIVFEGGVDQVLESLHALPFGEELARTPIETRRALKEALYKHMGPFINDGVLRGDTAATVIIARR